MIKFKSYEVTNICWYIYYNEWPDQEIDHKDRDGFNNKISNLRKATFSGNSANVDSRKRNKYHGVYYQTATKWVYQFKINGIRYRKTRFKTEIEAARVREKHLDQLGDTFCVRNKNLG